jgi:hypothetical protein
MHGTFLEAARSGFGGGSLTLEALLIVKVLKGAILGAFLWGLLRELEKLLR